MAAKEHERGTPRSPLSSTTRWTILSLSVAFSTGCTTWLLQSSLQNMTPMMVALVAAAGSVSTLVGVLHDATSHAVALTDSIILTFCLEYYYLGEPYDVSEAVVDYGKAILPLLSVCIVAVAMPSTFSLFSGVMNAWMAVAIMGMPLLSFLLGYMQYTATEPTGLDIPIEPLVALGISHFVLIAAWHINRPSKQLNLIPSGAENGKSFATAIALLMVVQAKGEILLPLLVGALVTASLYVYMGAVADSWYTVGSGQFWMVSLDGTSLIPYVLFPILVLVVRCSVKYGDSIRGVAVEVCKTLGLPPLDEPLTPEEMVMNALVMLITLGTVVGVPYVKSLCPIAGHLYGMTYTHGQQSTRKVAMVLPWSFSDLADEASKEKVALNFLVTASDLDKEGEKIKKTLANGHGTIINGDVASGYDAHRKALGEAPEWLHGEGMVVSQIAAASDRGMRVCLWSSTISKQTSGVTELLGDVEESLGGTIVYVQPSASTETIKEFIKAVTDKDYSFERLTEVAQRDLPMNLTDT